jgi:hypothetical protein
LVFIAGIICLLITGSFGWSVVNENVSNVVSLRIENANTGQNIPSTMHGVILETNINRGDDGGLYAELIYNRAFQGWSFSYKTCKQNVFLIFRKGWIT